MEFKIYQSQFAAVYNQIYRDKFYCDYANFISRAIKNNQIKSVGLLDIACGTGKLLNELNKLFKGENILIQGVDASRAMINIAIKGNKEIKFYNQKLTDLKIGRKFSVITCTFDSLNYITRAGDLDEVFKRIAKHLSPGGIFIFDFNTIYKKVYPTMIKDNVVYHNQIKGKFWLIDVLINKKGRIYKEKHREQLYSFKEIKTLLNKNNFKKMELYSAFNKKINKSNKYPRLFVVAKN